MFLYKHINGIWYIGKYVNKRRVNISTRTRSKTEANQKFLLEMNKMKLDLSGEIDFETFRAKVVKDAKASNFSNNSICLIEHSFTQLLRILNEYKLENPLISAVKTLHIQDLKVLRSSEVKPATVNIELRTLKGIFSRAVNWGYLVKNPCKGVSAAVEAESEILCMSPDELKAFFAAILEDNHRVIYMTALHTVCRRGELINLQMKDVLLNDMMIRIRNKPTFRTKTRKAREVPISAELHEVLTDYLSKRYGTQNGNILPMINENDYLFITPEGNPYSEDALTQRFSRIRDRAKLPKKYHLHCLRHTGISIMLNELKVPPTLVKEIAGHARLNTTMKYCHVNFQQKREAVNGINFKSIIG